MSRNTAEEIIEVNFTPIVACSESLPVTFLDVSFILQPGSLRDKLRTGWQRVRRLVVAICRGRYRLVVCRSFGRFVYRRDIPFAVNVARYLLVHLIKLGVRVWCARGAELVVLDIADLNMIEPGDVFLLDRCKLYFKRELPQNHWYVLTQVQPRHREPHLTILDPFYQRRLKKFRPLSLGIGTDKLRQVRALMADGQPRPKTHDVFFAGTVVHSTVRAAGLPLLRRLQERGHKVDVVEGAIPYPEFIERMARAWLVWSPEGLGWDCYRHYEVCALGAVPVINYPTIDRYRPLADGVHCFYYPVEGDGLIEVVETALADKERLRTMAAAAREFVNAHHTLANVAAYVLKESLAPPMGNPHPRSGYVPTGRGSLRPAATVFPRSPMPPSNNLPP